MQAASRHTFAFLSKWFIPTCRWNCLSARLVRSNERSPTCPQCKDVDCCVVVSPSSHLISICCVLLSSSQPYCGRFSIHVYMSKPLSWAHKMISLLVLFQRCYHVQDDCRHIRIIDAVFLSTGCVLNTGSIGHYKNGLDMKCSNAWCGFIKRGPDQKLQEVGCCRKKWQFFLRILLSEFSYLSFCILKVPDKESTKVTKKMYLTKYLGRMGFSSRKTW